MAESVVNTEGIDRLIGKLRSLEEIDFAPLMIEWRKILEEDNTEGIMQGLDGFGLPMTPVTYRPNPNKKKPTDYTILPGNNLTGSHYRALAGPPLAPRGLQSRVIANFRTADGRDADRWYALGAWEDVVSVEGIPFLPFHFRGEGNLPERNLARVRPGALGRARQALVEFVRNLLGRS